MLEPPETLADLLFHVRERWGGRADLLTAWDRPRSRLVSAAELISTAHALALALEGEGCAAGDRVALLAGHRPEWWMVDLAAHLLGLVTVPIRPSLPREQVGFVLRNSGAAWVFYGGREERERLAGLLPSLPHAPRLVAMDDEAHVPAGEAWTPLLGRGVARAVDLPLERFRGRVAPDHPASLAYTSGATGDPRGVVLSHANLVGAVRGLGEVLPLDPRDRALAALPWSHPLERVAGYLYLWCGVAIAAAPAGTWRELLPQIQPSVMVAPPGFLVDLRTAWEVEVSALPTWRRRLEHRAVTAAVAACLDPHPHLRSRLRRWWSRRLLARIRQRLGGRLHLILSGFSPLPAAAESFALAAGFEVCHGWGLTETTSVVTLNRPGRQRPGTVGRPLPETRLHVDRDGEVLVQGPSVMDGYWRSTTARATPVLGEQWLATGDLGRLERDGALVLEARRSSLLVTGEGEVVAPHPLEQRLQERPEILQAVVVGDGRPFLAALVLAAPHRGREPPEARVRRAIQEVNQQLPVRRRIRRFHLLARPLMVEAAELTPNLQLRRRHIAERYGEAIAALYEEDRGARNG